MTVGGSRWICECVARTDPHLGRDGFAALSGLFWWTQPYQKFSNKVSAPIFKRNSAPLRLVCDFRASRCFSSPLFNFPEFTNEPVLTFAPGSEERASVVKVVFMRHRYFQIHWTLVWIYPKISLIYSVFKFLIFLQIRQLMSLRHLSMIFHALLVVKNIGRHERWNNCV